MSLSLHARILLAATFILVAFLGVTGFILDQAFRDSARSAMEDRLQAQMYKLLDSVKPIQGKIVLVGDLPDSRMSLMTSKLYAEFTSSDNTDHWHSLSATGLKFSYTSFPEVGEQTFEFVNTRYGFEFYVISRGVRFDYGNQTTPTYILRIGEELSGFNPQINNFRTTLFTWLGGAALVLLFAQGIILNWGLKPLREVAKDLQNIEAGKADRLAGQYPKELSGLTDNLNALLESSRMQIRRYRDSLGNLAHSLKTPLAVLRNAVAANQNPTENSFATLAEEQVQRMSQIVDYQLKRAATAGKASLNAPIEVAPIVEKIIASMNKVYTDKAITAQLNLDPTLYFVGDADDLFEILGNIIDNAYKWAADCVRIEVNHCPASKFGFLLQVHDDGPGIPHQVKNRILQRGQRADPATAGQGIGLAVVHEIVLIYGGTIHIKDSDLGGALIDIQLCG